MPISLAGAAPSATERLQGLSRSTPTGHQPSPTDPASPKHANGSMTPRDNQLDIHRTPRRNRGTGAESARLPSVRCPTAIWRNGSAMRSRRLAITAKKIGWPVGVGSGGEHARGPCGTRALATDGECGRRRSARSKKSGGSRAVDVVVAPVAACEPHRELCSLKSVMRCRGLKL